MPTKLKRYCVSVPEDLLESLQDAAQHYHLPISRLMIFLCVRGLDVEKRRSQQELNPGALQGDSVGHPDVPVIRSEQSSDQVTARAVHQR